MPDNAPTPRKKRAVRVDRDGCFAIAEHPYCLRRGTSVLNKGLWECWDEDLPPLPEDATEAERLRHLRPMWVAESYRAARDLIDAAAERGHF